MSIKTMAELLELQESERQELAVGAFMAWKSYKGNERLLLSEYNYQYENAPVSTQKEIDAARDDFFAEWGSKGRLAALMTDRHEKEREKLTKQAELLQQLTRHRSKDNDHGR